MLEDPWLAVKDLGGFAPECWVSVGGMSSGPFSRKRGWHRSPLTGGQALGEPGSTQLPARTRGWGLRWGPLEGPDPRAQASTLSAVASLSANPSGHRPPRRLTAPCEAIWINGTL